MGKKCKSTMKKVGKVVLPMIAPTAVRALGEWVLILEDVKSRGKWKLTGDEVREFLVSVAQARTELDETTLRLTIEYLKTALVDMQLALEEVGGDTDDEPVTEEDVDKIEVGP